MKKTMVLSMVIVLFIVRCSFIFHHIYHYLCLKKLVGKNEAGQTDAYDEKGELMLRGIKRGHIVFHNKMDILRAKPANPSLVSLCLAETITHA